MYLYSLHNLVCMLLLAISYIMPPLHLHKYYKKKKKKKEKRLEKAERAAERKAAKRKKTVPERRPKPYTMRPQQVQPLPVTPTSALMTPVQRRPPPVTPLPQRQVGPCFACGQLGHLRSYCPKTAAGSGRQHKSSWCFFSSQFYFKKT